jgi:hypothetical protein
MIPNEHKVRVEALTPACASTGSIPETATPEQPRYPVPAASWRGGVDDVRAGGPVSSPCVAELTKLIENTFRHVNIALANELAMFGHELGVDVRAWNSYGYGEPPTVF